MDKRADYGNNADEWFAALNDSIAPVAMFVNPFPM
jgi:hypothetical protein